MAVLKFLSVAAAVIFFLEINWAYGADGSDHTENETNKNESNDQNTQTGVENGAGSGQGGAGGDGESGDVSNSAERVECWKQMNTARGLVDFAKLTQATILKIPSDSTAKADANADYKKYMETVCNAVKTNEKLEGAASTVAGTVAYAVQEGKEVDCQAAVDYWKAAFPKFNGLLPSVYTAGTPPYDTTQNISFISLFNPQASPKVDCGYFTCPATQKAESQQRNTNTDKEVKALICITTPNALTEGKQPYNYEEWVFLRQDEWDKITDVFSPSNAAAALPTALAFTAAAAAAAIFL